MKSYRIRIPLILSLTLLSIYTSAQSWSFIKPNERYHFQYKDDTIPLNTILIDSTAVVASDSVFYLNRLFLPCDTCSSEGLYLDNQPGFLQREFVYSQVSSTVQLNDPEKYTIHLPDNIEKEWWFDEAKTQRAALVSITKEEIFGIPDSIATINVNGEPQIRIAKNIGLIKYFDYELSGLENAKLGVCLPGWKDFYDFEVGDVFQYEFRIDLYQLPWKPYGYNKQEVKSMTTVNDTIKILWQNKLIEWWGALGMDTTIIRDWESTQIITKDDISNAYPNQKKEIKYNVYALPIYISTETGIQLFYNTSLEEPPFTGAIGYTDTAGYSDTVIYNLYSYLKYVYQIGLGNIETVEEIIGDGDHSKKLIGYTKKGDTTGIVYPDEYYVVPEEIDTTHIKNTKLFEKMASIYPNPSNGEITFDLGTESEAKIEIYTLEGRLVEQFETKNNQTQNLQQLNSGIYIISIQLNEGLQQLKWIKQ